MCSDQNSYSTCNPFSVIISKENTFCFVAQGLNSAVSMLMFLAHT